MEAFIRTFDCVLSPEDCDTIVAMFDTMIASTVQEEAIIDFSKHPGPTWLPWQEKLLMMVKMAVQQYVGTDMMVNVQHQGPPPMDVPDNEPVPDVMAHVYDTFTKKCVLHKYFKNNLTVNHRKSIHHCHDEPGAYLTYFLFLNDVEEGGHLEFANNFILRPQKGTLVVFPSSWFYTFIHHCPTSSHAFTIHGNVFRQLRKKGI